MDCLGHAMPFQLDSSSSMRAAASDPSLARRHHRQSTASSPGPRDADTVGLASVNRPRREPLEPLVVDALRSAGSRGLVLADICGHVIANSTDYGDPSTPSGYVGDGDDGIKMAERGDWRRNLRHILSTRDFFVRTGELNPYGRGGYWRLDECKYAAFVDEKRSAIQLSIDATQKTGSGFGTPRSTVDFESSETGSRQPIRSPSLPGEVLAALARLSALQDHPTTVDMSLVGSNQLINWAAVSADSIQSAAEFWQWRQQQQQHQQQAKHGQGSLRYHQPAPGDPSVSQHNRGLEFHHIHRPTRSMSASNRRVFHDPYQNTLQAASHIRRQMAPSPTDYSYVSHTAIDKVQTCTGARYHPYQSNGGIEYVVRSTDVASRHVN